MCTRGEDDNSGEGLFCWSLKVDIHEVEMTATFFLFCFVIGSLVVEMKVFFVFCFLYLF